LHLAEGILKAGYSVVVDATFLRAAQRQTFIRFADECQFPFVILDVGAPEEVLAQRLEWRAIHGTDASDATVKVMQMQKTLQEPLTDSERSHTFRIDSTDAESIQYSLKDFLYER
jgi:predicted kinase